MEKTNVKTLWFRVGTVIPLTEEEQKIIRKGGVDSASVDEYNAAAQLLASKLLSGGYRVSGEVYSPDRTSWSKDEWPHDLELNFELDMDIPPREYPKTEVKVLISDGITNDVLKNQDVPIDVEIVYDDVDYRDHEQLEEYQHELYKDPTFKSCHYTCTHFDNDGDDLDAEFEEIPEDMSRNTRISYTYIDAGSYKVHNECIVKGTFTSEQIEEILNSLDMGEFFIPYKVGLPEVKHADLGYNSDPTTDHDYFCLAKDGFEETNEAPSVDITANELVARFKGFCSGHWYPEVPF